MSGPQISWLPDSRRLHMNHGPIDLIVEAWGETREVRLAYEQAAARFETILHELVAELVQLRCPVKYLPPPLTPPHKGRAVAYELTTPSSGRFATTFSPRGEERSAEISSLLSPWGEGRRAKRRRGEGDIRAICDCPAPHKGEGGVSVSESPSPLWGGARGGGSLACENGFTSSTARRMAAAVTPFAPTFITPMAAVAGAVADEMLAALRAGRDLRKAYVNDGGDITLLVTPGEQLAVGIGGTGGGERFEVTHDMPVRGVATSGWRGRSHSLGIADAVTVLAASGAAADAAATIIANDVDLPGHPAIARAPAHVLQPDSDLGARLVTTGVGALRDDEIARALDNGLATAQRLMDRGLIFGAALFLGGDVRMVGPLVSERISLESSIHA